MARVLEPGAHHDFAAESFVSRTFPKCVGGAARVGTFSASEAELTSNRLQVRPIPEVSFDLVCLRPPPTGLQQHQTGTAEGVIETRVDERTKRRLLVWDRTERKPIRSLSEATVLLAPARDCPVFSRTTLELDIREEWVVRSAALLWCSPSAKIVDRFHVRDLEFVVVQGVGSLCFYGRGGLWRRHFGGGGGGSGAVSARKQLNDEQWTIGTHLLIAWKAMVGDQHLKVNFTDSFAGPDALAHISGQGMLYIQTQ